MGALLNPRALMAGALVAVLAFSHHWAYRTGVERTEARHAAAVADLNDRLARLSQKHAEATEAFLRERRAREALQEELDDEARNDPDMDDNGLPASSVRRLNAIR